MCEHIPDLNGLIVNEYREGTYETRQQWAIRSTTNRVTEYFWYNGSTTDDYVERYKRDSVYE